MSIFNSSISHRSFWWQISAVCFVLGLILAAAAFTATQFSREGGGPDNPALSYRQGMQMLVEKASQSDSEIKKLRESKTELENKLAQRNDASSTLNKELQDLKFFAGLTEAVGSGVIVTLKDVPQTAASATAPDDPINPTIYVHDEDIIRIINEMKAAGAEAIAVNGQRVVTTSAVRCAGPVVLVNTVPLAAPYVIQAIGEPDTLLNGLNIQHGVLDEMRRIYPGMVTVEKKAKLHLPAFAGSTQTRFSRPPKTAVTDDRKEKQDKEEERK